jgi:uncharacterized protein YceK
MGSASVIKHSMAGPPSIAVVAAPAASLIHNQQQGTVEQYSIVDLDREVARRWCLPPFQVFLGLLESSACSPDLLPPSLRLRL